MPAYRRAWFLPDLQFVNAGTESWLSGNNWRIVCKNAKCENELERRLPDTVCRVQRCTDFGLAVILVWAISIDGGVLKRKVQVYIFQTLI